MAIQQTFRGFHSPGKKSLSRHGRSSNLGASVPSVAHTDCLLWLWTTNAFLHDAYHIIDAWGFAPKTVLTWIKDRMGLGDWLRGQTEHCILGVKGKPVVALTNQTTALSGQRRKHSRKPDEFYSLVESLCPGSKIELFARQKRDGWASWGAENELFG
ncbi:MT-A70 family methyltransferase [Thermodesulfobacteriota bacterium]